MEDTHTTKIVREENWISILTIHDQSGSAVEGKVPYENIPVLIENLKKFISVNAVFPAEKSKCKHSEHKRIWIQTSSTWRCANCGAWYH